VNLSDAVYFQDFIPKLKKHLRPRIRQLSRPDLPATSDSDTLVEWNAVLFRSNRIYSHKILRINYTTYDVRRTEDIIHTGTSHCNVMVLNPDASADEHPFWYARVLGIFHANVVYTGDGATDFASTRLDFLWVRWYTNDCGTEPLPGILDCVRFPPLADEYSFGFLDPSLVLRAAHIIPLFSRGIVHPDGSGVSHWAEDVNDWRIYCISRYGILRLFM
jgi:hypothetical protein